MIAPASHSIEFESGKPSADGVTIIISVYQYENFVEETLRTIGKQTFAPLSLVVVEDKGADNSLARCRSWLEGNASRLQYALLVQHSRNFGLATARNTAFSLAHTQYIFVLDADNHLYPRCVEHCHAFLNECEAAFAYPIIEKFGDQVGLLGMELWSKQRLSLGNYIDAMALVRKSAWESVGGYSKMKTIGWEDYDMWCKFADCGWEGVRVPMVLARYRVHRSSMLNTVTNAREKAVKQEMMERHPWLCLW